MHDLREYWNFSDPEASRKRFLEILPNADNASIQIQIRCQIARTYGLQRQFEEAHRLLDQIEPQIGGASDRAQAAYHLERGRTFNSSGKKPDAQAEFLKAVETEEDDYRVDAYHMLAICAPNPEAAEAWNLQALELTERSSDIRAKRWRASLLNNIAWTFHDTDRAEQALDLFHEAVQLREKEGDAEKVRAARWCYARCLRTLGRYSEALNIQLELQEGAEDGYVPEEIGELLLAMESEESAKLHFAKAYDLLSKDEWLVAEQPERLARLRKLGGVA